MIPIDRKTRYGIEVFKWVEHFVKQLELMGHTWGWAFQCYDGVRVNTSEYMNDIYEKLEFIQSTTNHIDPACNVRQGYGAMHLGRCFFDTECLKQGVSPSYIAFQCRWSADRAKGVVTVLLRHGTHLSRNAQHEASTYLAIGPSLEPEG
jgi:hypothetical protein